MSEPLKPCPFCGGPGYACKGSTYWVRCDDCFAEGRGTLTPEGAAANWNSRTTDATVATLTAEVARLKALVGKFVTGDDAGYRGYRCLWCRTWADSSTFPAVYAHAPDCLIVRARAALTPEATPEAAAA